MGTDTENTALWFDISHLCDSRRLHGENAWLIFYKHKRTERKMFALSSGAILQSFYYSGEKYTRALATSDFVFFASMFNIRLNILRAAIIKNSPWD